jgi:hypothetical protein
MLALSSSLRPTLSHQANTMVVSKPGPPKRSLEAKSTGEITNLMAVDAQRLQDLMSYFSTLVSEKGGRGSSKGGVEDEEGGRRDGEGLVALQVLKRHSSSRFLLCCPCTCPRSLSPPPPFLYDSIPGSFLGSGPLPTNALWPSSSCTGSWGWRSWEAWGSCSFPFPSPHLWLAARARFSEKLWR